MATVNFQNGSYKRSVGSSLNDNGERKQRTFSLGKNKPAAEALSERIEIEWKRAKLAGSLPLDPTTGKPIWSDELLTEVAGWIATAKATPSVVAPQPPAAQPVAPVKAAPEAAKPRPVVPTAATPAASPKAMAPENVPTGLTLFAAMEKFIGMKASEANLGQSRKRSIRQRLETVKLAFGSRDLPLERIGYDEIAAAMGWFKSYPISERTGQGLAALTIISAVQVFSQFFDWLDLSGKWIGFRRWEDMFKLPRKRLLSAEAKSDEGDDDADNVPTFNPSDLATLWNVANSRQRVYFGLGLFCGFLAVDVATLRKNHVKEIDGETFIESGGTKQTSKGVGGYRPKSRRF